MINIYDLLNEGYGDIQLKVTANDLKEFADHIIANIHKDTPPTQVEEESMTRQQVMRYLGIKPTTLHIWTKKGLLKPTRIGRKIYYLKSDIMALQRGEVKVENKE